MEVRNTVMMKIRYLIKAFLRILIVLSFLGGFLCGMSAMGSAFISDDEYGDYYNSLMERDIYFKWRQIGHEYGSFVQRYYYYNYIEHSQEETNIVNDTINSFSQHKDLFSKAIANNFAVPVDLERDKRIMRDYQRLQSKQQHIERKLDPHNRFKDTMAWIGGMFSLFFITYLCYKALMYMGRYNDTDVIL